MKLNDTPEVFELIKLLKHYQENYTNLQKTSHIHITFPVVGDADAHLHYSTNNDHGLALRLLVEQKLLLVMQDINNQLLEFGINVELD